jgi:ABC-2 type transport system permease protein
MREPLVRPLWLLRASAANAWADMWVLYSPLTWTLGWVSRVLAQVTFFALIGLLLDSPDALRYLFIGNAAMVTAVEALISVATTTWERRQGTLPLLVAAPSRLWPVFVGRSIQWVVTGVLTSSIALFGLGPAFGVTWTPARAAAAFATLVVAAVSTYLFALVLGALVLAATDLRNLVANLAQVTMMLTCGVMVPVSFWPGWVQTVAQALPLTHALRAIRALADAPPGAPLAGEVAAGVLAALGVGAAWLVVAALLLERLASAGRRTGSIEFAD